MDPLKYLFEKPAMSGRLSRWLILLAEFDLKYVGKKIIKGSVMLDFCTKNPIEGEDGKEDYLGEDILDIELGAWKMYCDEAVNQYRNGIEVLLIAPDGSHVPLVVKLNFEATLWIPFCSGRKISYRQANWNGKPLYSTSGKILAYSGVFW